MSTRRRCKMCGNGSDQWKNGHAFPTWTASLLQNPDEKFSLESGGPHEETRDRKKRAGPDVMVKICASCEDSFPEDDWKKELSGVIRRPLVTDYFTVDGQASLAAFALKIALIEDLSHRRRRIPDTERRLFMETLRPSNNCLVYAGTYLGDLPYYAAENTGPTHLIEEATSATSEVNVTTLKVGYLILQIVTFLTPERVTLGRHGPVAQIWPATDALRWPPSLSGYDEDSFKILCRLFTEPV